MGPRGTRDPRLGLISFIFMLLGNPKSATGQPSHEMDVSIFIFCWIYIGMKMFAISIVCKSSWNFISWVLSENSPEIVWLLK